MNRSPDNNENNFQDTLEKRVSDMLLKIEGLENRVKKLEKTVKNLEKEVSATGLFDKGRRLFKAGKYPQAIEAFSKAVRLNSKYEVAYYLRGAIYNKLGNRDKALEDLKAAARFGHKKSREFLKSRGIDW